MAQPKAVQRPTPVLDLAIGGRAGNLAPEFKGISNWINSEPLTMSDLQGKVVLIDFWTYTCVNCIRTFPFLKEWHAKYAGHGLVIVGVHSPEFDFEKLPENVARSTAESGLLYPIAQDNDFETWRAYSNRYWPAKYLIDHNGVVRYTHFGEGAYDETEHWIRDVLGETGVDLSGIEANADPGPSPDPKAFTSNHKERITREIYAGYQRNSSPMGLYISNTEYYKGSERVVTYSDMEPHQNQFMYLQGPWFNGLEELRHARETQNNEDHIALKFFASSVNAVIDSANGDSFQVDVTMDGRALLPEEAGADLILADGRSFLEVDEGRMYMVVELSEFGGHELRLSSNSDKFEFFAFTFGAYPSGP